MRENIEYDVENLEKDAAENAEEKEDLSNRIFELNKYIQSFENDIELANSLKWNQQKYEEQLLKNEGKAEKIIEEAEKIKEEMQEEACNLKLWKSEIDFLRDEVGEDTKEAEDILEQRSQKLVELIEKLNAAVEEIDEASMKVINKDQIVGELKKGLEKNRTIIDGMSRNDLMGARRILKKYSKESETEKIKVKRKHEKWEDM